MSLSRRRGSILRRLADTATMLIGARFTRGEEDGWQRIGCGHLAKPGAACMRSRLAMLMRSRPGVRQRGMAVYGVERKHRRRKHPGPGRDHQQRDQRDEFFRHAWFTA